MFGEWKHAEHVRKLKTPADKAVWQFRTLSPGYYFVELEYSAQRKNSFQEAVITLDDEQLTFLTMDTGEAEYQRKNGHQYGDRNKQFKNSRIGLIHVKKAGMHTLTVHPAKDTGKPLFNLKNVKLIPTLNEN